MKYGNLGAIIKSNNKYDKKLLNKYDKKLLPQHTIITKINAQLQHNLRTHYKHRKFKNTLNFFEEKFCINEALAKVEHNSLKIFLQEYVPAP